MCRTTEASSFQFLFSKAVLEIGGKVGREEGMGYFSFYSDFHFQGEIVGECLHEADSL